MAAGVPTAPASTRVSALFVSAGVAGNQLASYLLNVLAARLLVPAAFGELGSLLAVLVIGAVPAMGMQTVTALRVARRDSPGELVALGLTTAACVTAVALAAVPLLMVLLHLASPAPAILVAFSLAGITFRASATASSRVSTGSRPWPSSSGADAVLRVGGTLAGLAITRTATGALAGTAIGAAVVAVTGWVLCGRPRPRRHGKAHVSDVLHAVSAMLALVLLVNLDLVLARHYLPAHDAGEYAVGAIVAKIAYWLPQAVAILVLPRLASEQGRRRMVPDRARGLRRARPRRCRRHRVARAYRRQRRRRRRLCRQPHPRLAVRAGRVDALARADPAVLPDRQQRPLVNAADLVCRRGRDRARHRLAATASSRRSSPPPSSPPARSCARVRVVELRSRREPLDAAGDDGGHRE